MKKLKLLSFIFFITIFSCTLPTEIIEPQINGVKISKEFKNITDMVVTDNEDIYIVDNNVIKKIDSKGEITIIAGNEKEEINTENIDGDIKTAKFGKINKIQYVEKEKTIYFEDDFAEYDKEIKSLVYRYLYLRKISNENKIKTILKIDRSFTSSEMRYPNSLVNIDISKDGYFYISNTNLHSSNDRNLKKLNTNLEEISNENIHLPDLENQEYFISKTLESPKSNLYFTLQSGDIVTSGIGMIILKINNKFIRLESFVEGSFSNLLIDEKEAIYIHYRQGYFYNRPSKGLTLPTRIELPRKVTQFIFKLDKNEIDNYSSLNQEQKEKLMEKNIIGDIPKDFQIYSVNGKKKIIYATDKKYIYKIKIGENK